jgi:sortase A
VSSSSFGIRGRVIETEDSSSRRRPGSSAGSRPAPGRQILKWIAALLACFALWEFSSAGWIHAKALVAQYLIASSWKDARASGRAQRPWPWADTRAIAKLTLAARGVELYVLEGSSGRSLAFGPGHVDGTAMPGGSGNSVIVAHRDTHFAFLRDLASDEEITVEDAKGRTTRYRVREVSVVGKDETRVLDEADSPQLTLITCYPFDAVRAGTPLRYVVIADRIG